MRNVWRLVTEGGFSTLSEDEKAVEEAKKIFRFVDVEEGVFLTNQELEDERQKAFKAGTCSIVYHNFERMELKQSFADYAASLEQKGETNEQK